MWGRKPRQWPMESPMANGNTKAWGRLSLCSVSGFSPTHSHEVSQGGVGVQCLRNGG